MDFAEFLLLPRFWITALFCMAGLALLLLGRINRTVRFVSLAVIFFVFAVIPVLPLGDFSSGMGMHPSPMCAVTKPLLFLYHRGFIPVIFIAVLLVIGVLSLLGNKLFCGWACPLGAIQEVMQHITIPRKWRITLPFRITNTIRASLFILYFILILSVGMNIYGYFNPFEFLHWYFSPYLLAVMIITLTASLFIFRPFCYLVCPIGLLTWCIEALSMARLHTDRTGCNDCALCRKKSNCPAVPAVLEGKRIRPDCHACGRCMDLCPEKALMFGFRQRRKGEPPSSTCHNSQRKTTNQHIA